MVATSTLVGLAINPRWGSSAVDLLYLPAVLGAAILGGLRPAIFAALASALAYNYFFTAPERTFMVDSPADLVTVIVLFLVAMAASQLAASARAQAQIASAHASRNATIAGLARDLLSCTTDQEIAGVACRQLAALLGCNVVLLAGGAEPKLIASVPASVQLGAIDKAAATLTHQTGQPSGRGVTRGNASEWQFHAVSSSDTPSAIIGLARDDGGLVPSPQYALLFDNLLDQVALALDRARLETEARHFTAVRERDRIRSALVASIGRDLSPRLASIIGTAADLQRSGGEGRALASSITSDAKMLERYISNLVDLGIDGGQQPVEVGELSIDLFQRSVRRAGKEVHLTPKEYSVLAELAKHPGRVLTHNHLLRAVWGPAQERQIDYLRVAVRGLRQKLERDPSQPQLIENEPAVGYRLRR